MLGATGILVGTFFLNSLYLQDVAGTSPLRAGLEFLPLVAVIGLGAHLTPRLLPHTGSRVLAAIGLALMAGGALLLAGASARSGYVTGLLPGLLVIGAGTGLVFPAASVTAMSDIAADQAGLASGLMTAAHEIGATLGVAVFGAVAAAWPPRTGSRSGTGTVLGRGERRGRAGLCRRGWPSRPCGPRPAPGWRCTEMTQRAADYQRAIAERNVEAIRDAVEELLDRRIPASISAVAAQAGVSRVTVYAHFPTGEAMLEAAVERAVRRTMAALGTIDLDDGLRVRGTRADARRGLAAPGPHAMAQAVAEQIARTR